MKAMETLQDLIEEAKVRTLWWAICIFGIAYFLSHTSKSMWTNIPIAFLMLSALRLISHEVEFCWKVQPIRRPTYLSHLRKKQLPLDDPRVSPLPTAPTWRRKIDLPLVEAAVDDFVNKILQDFMIDLWYSAITPDREVPEQIHALIKDVIGEISGRIKEINLVDLLTRDMVDLIGDHLDLYRRNQSSIGVAVMGTLSSEERDERLRHHLIASGELHPALFSSECEYKVLQRLMGGVIAVVLRPSEAECQLVRSLGREFLTCLVMQPIMNFASPGYINELIEFIFLAANDDASREVSHGRSNDASGRSHDRSVAAGINQGGEAHVKKTLPLSNQMGDPLTKISDSGGAFSAASERGHMHASQADSLHNYQPHSADWARVLDAAQQRRTQVLTPENLENLWTKGRNYGRKSGILAKAGASSGSGQQTSMTIDSATHIRNRGNEESTDTHRSTLETDDKSMMQMMQSPSTAYESGVMQTKTQLSQDLNKGPSREGTHHIDGWDHSNQAAKDNKNSLKRSSSMSALKNHPDIKTFTREGGGTTCSKEFHNPSVGKEEPSARSASSALVFDSEGSHSIPKLKCRVTGAYFEKNGSKSFAVYSIAVRDADNRGWVVKRRYRNFERLHRHLKDIPNYTLQLPPKRFLSSSIDDSFVHQRCILLDKYLQDLLSIANVAEQHEVWDFLSVSSKNYAFGKSPSVMRTLAVNVDDAMDDIVRQFRGVSDGLLRKVSGSSSLPHATSSSITEKHMALPWNDEVSSKHSSIYSNRETSHSLSDNEEEGTKHGTPDEMESAALINGWHSDNELNSKGFPPRVLKRAEESRGMVSENSQQSYMGLERLGMGGYLTTDIGIPISVPPEWTPPKLSMPLLNLVDKIFQLKRRGWLRRQVFWISKQILQLMMEDAIDDWLLRQINWLRRDDVIAQGVRWVQDVLWPNGIFFLKLENDQDQVDGNEFEYKPTQNTNRLGGDKVPRPGSFELQLEASRRASYVKKTLLDGAPTALVSLIGHKQYRRCAEDIYYFLQSTVCLKQLAYCMLELLLLSVFPELHDLIRDLRRKANYQAP